MNRCQNPWTVRDAFNTVGGDMSCRNRHEKPEVDAVADHIRVLGYTVVCGYDLDAGMDNVFRKQSYVIIAIRNQEGEYVYGGPDPPTEWEENPETRAPCWTSAAVLGAGSRLSSIADTGGSVSTTT